MEDYYTARLRGSVAQFEKSVLVGGLLGVLNMEGVVEWRGIVDGVGYQYWDLYG